MNTIQDRSEREEVGAEVMRRLGIDPDEVIAGVAPLDERFGHTIVEYIFGDIVARPELDLRTSQLATLAILTTLGGCGPQLELHLRATLKAGATRTEIVGLLTHVAAYAGIPRVMNALAVAKRALPSGSACPKGLVRVRRASRCSGWARGGRPCR